MRVTSLLTTTICLVLLVSCGAPQDNGDGDGSPMISRAVDGYLALAYVYHDMNLDGSKDDFEPAALTDKDGYLSYNPITDTNYCADSASDKYVHCLLINAAEEGAVTIRLSGGYDSINAIPFNGNLALTTDITSVSPQNPAISTPLTSLIKHFSSSQLDAFKTREGLSGLTGGEDYLAFSDQVTGTPSANELLLAKLALSVHKTADVISEAMRVRYASNQNLPASFTSDIYSQLASLLASEAVSVNVLLNDQTRLETLITNVSSAIASSYGLTSPVTDPTNTVIANQAGELMNTIDYAFQYPVAGGSKDKVFGAFRAIEVTNQLARDFSAADPAAYLSTYVTPASTKANDQTVGGYMEKISDTTVADVSSLVAKFKTGSFTVETDFLARQSFDALTGTGLDGKTLDLASGADSVSMDFVTSPGSSVEGSVTISLPAVGGEPAVEMQATWQMMDDYSLILVVDGIDNIMIKPVSQDGGGVTYLFDLNGEVIEWDAASGDGFSNTPA